MELPQSKIFSNDLQLISYYLLSMSKDNIVFAHKTESMLQHKIYDQDWETGFRSKHCPLLAKWIELLIYNKSVLTYLTWLLYTILLRVCVK